MQLKSAGKPKWSDISVDSEDDLWTQSSASTDQVFEEDSEAVRPSEVQLPPQEPLRCELTLEDHRRLVNELPRDPRGLPTSIGSLKHATNDCIKCPYIPTAAGCLHGIMCEKCHMPHRSRRSRPCKEKRQRLRKREARERTESTGTTPRASSLGGDSEPSQTGENPANKLSL